MRRKLRGVGNAVAGTVYAGMMNTDGIFAPSIRVIAPGQSELNLSMRSEGMTAPIGQASVKRRGIMQGFARDVSQQA
jgi:hypothetical protein